MRWRKWIVISSKYEEGTRWNGRGLLRGEFARERLRNYWRDEDVVLAT